MSINLILQNVIKISHLMFDNIYSVPELNVLLITIFLQILHIIFLYIKQNVEQKRKSHLSPVFNVIQICFFNLIWINVKIRFIYI